MPTRDEYAAAFAELGSNCKVAERFGVNESSVRRSLMAHKALETTAAANGFPADAVSHYWHRTRGPDGEGISAFVKVDPGDKLSAIEAALSRYDGAAPVIDPPSYADADLLNLVAVPDWHAGMQAWRRDAGQDYDLKIADHAFRASIGRTMARLPQAGRCVLLFPGDTIHTNDARNMTPRSGHILDVDGRFLKIMEVACSAVIWATETALRTHEAVEVVVLPGNHDPEAALMLALAVRMFFSREPRVTVHDGAGLWWAHQHGANMLTATHGHNIKPREIGLYVATEWPQMWGATKWRFNFRGHDHHERSIELPGIISETLRPLTARDAHAAGSYHSQREISGMTFHRERGRVSRVYEAIA